MLGFNEPSPLRGPPEEKDAASLNVTSGRFAGATEAVCGEGAATKVGVSLSSNSMKGMVTLVSSGLKNPAPLFTTPTAAAPAASAFAAFWLKLQVPREIMTIAPAAPLAG